MCKVSIIVPCYNYGRFLEKCIYSILHQSMEDFEIILINDASSDETRDVLEQFIDNPKIKIIHHAHNIGFHKTVNEGVRIAKGKYIAMVNADDYLVNKDAITLLWQGFNVYTTSSFLFRKYFYKDVNLYYPLIFRPRVIFTYYKSLLGDSILCIIRRIKRQLSA